MDQDLLTRIWVAWQPVVDLARRVPIGHEALIRGPADSPWATPSGLFAWAEREDRAEALERACRVAALTRARRAWPPGQLLFLNLDARWPRLPDPWDHRAVDGIPLVLELSERQALLDHPQLLRALVRWRHAGHLLALDDYGTGYAAAATVVAIQPHGVKLDRVLISGIDRSPEKRSLLRALRAWTRDLNIRLIAEGVETAEELNVVQELGCDYAQGFFLGRPEPVLQTHSTVVVPSPKASDPGVLSLIDHTLGFYVATIQDSRIPSYVVDTRRRMVAWNQAAENLLGFPGDILVGHACFRSPLDHQNQAGHRLCVGACPLVTAMAERTTLRDRVSVRTRTGSRRIVDVSVVPIIDTSTGRVVGALEQFQLAAGWEEAEDSVSARGVNGSPNSAPSPKRPSVTRALA
jgi:PAS domain S-box-containing protein